MGGDSSLPPQGSQYEYEPLEPTKNEIRLVRVHRARSGPIECDMRTRRLYGDENDDDNKGDSSRNPLSNRTAIPYEAVSYLWGSSELCKTIWIVPEGKWLPVTASVFELLSRLRSAGRHEYLWIDAICMNQDDDVEKGHQVQQMGRVYAKARRVIFHLGCPTRNTDLLMEALWRLQMSDRENRATGDSCGSKQSITRAWDRVQVRIRRRPGPVWSLQREGLYELLGRSWFERVWVIQEVWNAKDAIFHCGRWAVSSRIFVAAPELLSVSVADQRQKIIDAMPGATRRIAATSQQHDLYTMLRAYRHAAASKERDKIYALLGLCDNREDDIVGTLLTDYTIDDCEVVQRTVAYLCGCNVECLPRDSSANVSSLLNGLENLHLRTFSLLVQSTETEAVDGIAFMLARRRQYFKVTPSVIEDAARNEINGAAMIQLFLSAGHLNSGMERIVQVASRNQQQGRTIAQLLAERNPCRPHKRRRCDVYETSLPLVSEKRSRSWARLYAFFNKNGASLGMAREVVEAAVANHHDDDPSVMQNFLETGDWRVIATPLLLAAAQHSSNACNVIALILRHRGARERCSDIELASFIKHHRPQAQLLNVLDTYVSADDMVRIIAESRSISIWGFLTLGDVATQGQTNSTETTAQLALRWALRRHNLSMLQPLVERGLRLDPNITLEYLGHETYPDHAALHWGTDDGRLQRPEHNHSDAMRMLCSSANNFLITLSVTCNSGDTAILDYLLRHRAIADDSPLACKCNLAFHAAAASQYGLVRYLLDRNVVLDTFPYWAKQQKMTRGFLRKKRYMNLAATADLLREAASRGDDRLFEVLSSITSSSKLFSGEDARGSTALQHAAYEGHIGYLFCLLLHGADVNATDHNGRTALHFAAQGHQSSSIAHLLRNRAAINAKCKAGRTPLDVAAWRNLHDSDVVLELQRHGATGDATTMKRLQGHQMGDENKMSSDPPWFRWFW